MSHTLSVPTFSFVAAASTFWWKDDRARLRIGVVVPEPLALTTWATVLIDDGMLWWITFLLVTILPVRRIKMKVNEKLWVHWFSFSIWEFLFELLLQATLAKDSLLKGFTKVCQAIKDNGKMSCWLCKRQYRLYEMRGGNTQAPNHLDLQAGADVAGAKCWSFSTIAPECGINNSNETQAFHWFECDRYPRKFASLYNCPYEERPILAYNFTSIWYYTIQIQYGFIFDSNEIDYPESLQACLGTLITKCRLLRSIFLWFGTV